MYGNDESTGVFSTTLDSPMEDGMYSYYACCPAPASLSGTNVAFKIPSTQDGTGSCDAMVSYPASHGPLQGHGAEDGLELRLKHLTHLWDFYLIDNDGLLDGEPVKSIEIDLPRSITGDITADLATTAASYSADGSKTLNLDLENWLEVSSADSKQYASAVVLPFTAEPGDFISMTLHTENKTAKTEKILLGGRTFAAGHATPVMLLPTSATQIYNAYFTIAANHLGEDIQTIRITGPAGCRFGDGGSNTWTCTPDEALAQGGKIRLSYTNQADFMSISGKSISIEFESENAIVSGNATIPAISGTSCNTDLTVPYLYFEDFSGTTKSDEYDSTPTTSVPSAGNDKSVDLSGRGWPSGWYGARCGIKKGDKIRLLVRGERAVWVPGSYNGRIDSPAMSNIKPGSSGVHLKVEFDFASGWNGSKDNTVNYYMAIGTHQTTGGINSVGGAGKKGLNMDNGSIIYEDLTFVPGASKMSKDTYPETSDHFSCTTSQLCYKNSRIAWETYLKDNTGDGYYNFWVFIDNIRISIAK